MDRPALIQLIDADQLHPHEVGDDVVQLSKLLKKNHSLPPTGDFRD